MAYKRKLNREARPVVLEPGADVTSMTISDVAAQKVVPTETLTALPWWGKLASEEQTDVLTEAEALARQLYVNGHSRLAIGKHLKTIQTKLEPHGLFSRFLRYFGFKRTVAYRRIAEYNNSAKFLPPPVLRVAMAKNINILGESEERPLGVYTEAVRRLPPPQDPTEDQAVTYLDQLEDVRKKMKVEFTVLVPQVSVAEITKTIYKAADNALKKLDADDREDVLKSVFAMLLKKYEVGPVTLKPRPIPADYLIGRGRPRQEVAA